MTRWPLACGVLAFATSLVLTRVRPAPGSIGAALWFGDAAAARALLQTVSTSVMAATTLTFSLTVVALQLASQQFSPRLLVEFARDPVTKRVISILVTTFVLSTVSLYGIRETEPVPTFSLAAALLLGLASLAAIVAFIGHMVKVLRVDTMMLVVHDDTVRAIDRFCPAYDDRRGVEWSEQDDARATVLLSPRSGFLQETNVDLLVARAAAHEVVVHVIVRAGDHVVTGTPLALIWKSDTPAGVPADEALAAATEAFTIGYERTLDQDVAFGFRQLEDIAVKAMSPAINDPTTADNAVGHMADLLVRLVGCRLGATMHCDSRSAPRALVPDRDLRYYFDLCCGQLTRFGAEEPTVLAALLRMLRDVAVACRDDEQRDEVRRAAAYVVGSASPADDELPDLAGRVEAALCGDVVGAFVDRAGETRSI